MNRILIPIVILFVWLSQAGSSSLKNIEYAEIVSELSRTSELGECKISVDITRSWPFSWTARSASINVKTQDMALTSFTSKFNAPDRSFLKSHNTNYHFTWSRQLRDRLVASFVDVEIQPNGSVYAVTIGNCPNYADNNELIGKLEYCNSPVQVIKCT
ncbi:MULTISPECIES: hypothetical protein [unclassified Colwellia]|uniref:hypothetical protein n=1 Tax=unclassified Colwellia TaxID=196834 RepID=UPI0015F504CE|nr:MULTISPECIES: hypothetical protein [unclassified Colwellia]MBA6354204.1 hypothetical protein [Colwellia sp. BRX9-1]MBA6355661.1 hypothetical protein [Colwellia sp. BRX8-3]MBA6361470.1 hypothetical protein [Colwellia sp. BRX8-6]MBA6367188.1 hypothetical protein [Colwellia sp. BRX8-5]MBA6376968.1 hypothetical protein [Colwellia sp. BRX8-2]